MGKMRKIISQFDAKLHQIPSFSNQKNLNYIHNKSLFRPHRSCFIPASGLAKDLTAMQITPNRLYI